MDAVLYGNVVGPLAAHSVTTLYYFLAKGAVNQTATESLHWLLSSFEIASCDKDVLTQAVTLGMKDYEDAVTCISAQRTGCSCIVTRNGRDFAGSIVPAHTPSEFLHLIGNS